MRMSSKSPAQHRTVYLMVCCSAVWRTVPCNVHSAVVCSALAAYAHVEHNLIAG